MPEKNGHWHERDTLPTPTPYRGADTDGGTRPAPEVRSTIQTPNVKQLRAFRPWMIDKADTIRSYLAGGSSLGICCCDCRRLVEWTPPELLRRFTDDRDLKIVDLLPRLSCKGSDGCGSRHIAVFEHLYDGRWSWPPQAVEGSARQRSPNDE